ncbi:type II secretion system protein [Pelotalea chapellei]|uniref:Type II secretion system protein n=1 Tax=Pelotalea chapellei TaxID=44671 RepID=A0ABS5U9Z0_9BACT|nr:type II secretion system protein [Pelotalea chapellei]MBT1072489.1 type II secretion system protein [Pelotalea chapellei]
MENKLDNKGFTYLMALMLIMIMGIMMGMVGQSWKTIIQREREEELLFRGVQIRDAIARWYKPRTSGTSAPRQPTPLWELKDLLDDPSTPSTDPYLRKLYLDPITGKEWEVIKDPNKGIVGVASTSPAKPLKIGGFPDDLKDFTEKQKYSDWKFIYTAAGTTPGNNQAGTLAGRQR